MIWREALDSSWMVADSSSAVALICSADEALDLAGARRLGGPRQLLGGRLSLLERLGLLADRRLGLVGRARLLLRGAGDQHGALLGLAGGAVGLERGGQRFLAALGDLLHVLAQPIERRDHGGAVPSLRLTAVSAAFCSAAATSRTSAWIAVASFWTSCALFSDVSASARTSSATTAKPRP